MGLVLLVVKLITSLALLNAMRRKQNKETAALLLSARLSDGKNASEVRLPVNHVSLVVNILFGCVRHTM